MGNDIDLPLKYDEPLEPQTSPLWTVDSRFCINKEVTLLLREKMAVFSRHNFDIEDASSGQAWFRIIGTKFSVYGKRTLYDIDGVPLFMMKDTAILARKHDYPQIIMYEGNGGSKTELFTICPDFTYAKANVYTKILNRHNNHRTLLTMKGSTRDAMVYIGEEKEGGIPIAKIHRLRGEFYLTVAANVDISLMVALCDSLKHEAEVSEYTTDVITSTMEQVRAFDRQFWRTTGPWKSEAERQRDRRPPRPPAKLAIKASHLRKTRLNRGMIFKCLPKDFQMFVKQQC